MSVFDRLAELMDAGAILGHPQADGRGVRVCVIDSGIDRASLLERHPGSTPVQGVVFEPDRPEPLPYDGKQSAPHGTTVADVILKIAPKAELFSADIFGSRGSSEVETVVRAIRHATDVWGCKVINLSLGVTEQKLLQPAKRQQLLRTVEESYFRDVLLVAAAHNEHPFTRSYPAMFSPPLVSVDKGVFESPLQFAYRLVEQVEFRANGRGYTGPFAREPATSWAAPHLSGIAARLLSLKPDMKPFEVKTILYWLARDQGSNPGGTP